MCLLLLLGACEGQIGGSALGGDEPFGEPRPTGGPVDEVFPEAEALDPVARRLTTDEYARTVRDVVGVNLSKADLGQLPEARPIEGFVHVASGQTVSTDHVRAYSALARRIVEHPEFGSFIDKHSSCEDASLSCGDAFVQSAAAALFRHALSWQEADAFDSLFEEVLAEQAGFREAASIVTEAMLQSPRFLYLLQAETQGANGIRTVEGYEMASRLSYFLWGSAPDGALYEAAANGDLDTAEGVEEQAMRMLEERDRVREGLARFVVDWARVQSIPNDDGLKEDRIAGAVAYYSERVESGSDLFALFGDGWAFFTPELAESYGIEAQGDSLQEYVLPEDMGPGGLLGQPGIIAGMTNADGGEIVARGLFLMSQLFCQTPPQFAASLQEAIDEFIAGQPADASDREIAEARLLRPSCEGCHSSFDPLAYGFEQFDFQGSFRTADEHGNVLGTDGWIPANLSDTGAKVPYGDVDAYMALLAESLSVRRCMARHQTEFALGLRMGAGQKRPVAEIGAASEADGGDHKSLVRAIVTHPLFRTMAVPQ